MRLAKLLKHKQGFARSVVATGTHADEHTCSRRFHLAPSARTPAALAYYLLITRPSGRRTTGSARCHGVSEKGFAVGRAPGFRGASSSCLTINCVLSCPRLTGPVWIETNSFILNLNHNLLNTHFYYPYINSIKLLFFSTFH